MFPIEIFASIAWQLAGHTQASEEDLLVKYKYPPTQYMYVDHFNL